MSADIAPTTTASNVAPLVLRARGALTALDAETRRVITDRTLTADPTVRAKTSAIIERVRTDGDDALREFARDFDGVNIEQLEVPRHYWQQALNTLDPQLRNSLERAARNITAVHTALIPDAVEVSPELAGSSSRVRKKSTSSEVR